MSVESLNNNNTVMYATGGALAGATIGGTIVHVTKSVLKDGNYTDEFVSSTYNNAMKSKNHFKAVKEVCLIGENENLLEGFCKIVKKSPEIFGFDNKNIKKIANLDLADLVNLVTKDEEATSLIEEMQDTRNELIEHYGEKLKLGKDTNIEEIMKKELSEALDEVFDRSKNAFKEGVQESKDNILKEAKKAYRSIKLKSAGIYGGIGAAVLGVAGYLFASNKNQDKPQEPQG